MATTQVRICAPKKTAMKFQFSTASTGTFAIETTNSAGSAA